MPHNIVYNNYVILSCFNGLETTQVGSNIFLIYFKQRVDNKWKFKNMLPFILSR